MAKVLKCSRSGYYSWVESGFYDRQRIEYENLLALILEVFNKSPKTYDARRISVQLRKTGRQAGRRRA